MLSPIPPLLGSATVLLIYYLATFASGATLLPLSEEEALKQIAKTLGKNDWNFSADPCSGEWGWATPNATNGFQNAVTCGNCSSDNTTCHIIGIWMLILVNVFHLLLRIEDVERWKVPDVDVVADGLEVEEHVLMKLTYQIFQISHPILQAGYEEGVRHPDRLFRAVESMTYVLQGQHIDEPGPSSSRQDRFASPTVTYTRRRRHDD